MAIRKLEVGSLHTAFVCPMTGEGLLVLPHPDDEVELDPDPLTGSGSLVYADWLAAIQQLDRLGWEPSTVDDAGFWVREGFTSDGRTVIGLFGRALVISRPACRESAESYAELCRAALR